MKTAGNTLFEQFADALNAELAATQATLRVDRAAPSDNGSLTLVDLAGQAIGCLPDHVDAATIVAVEDILRMNRDRSAVV